ncbi:LysM peptidoglycan-binding domain-containing protein [Pollutibacter soli]|uniref:LysM peptidoglycan-binding domain-containing protein n=1 Tax=Pollutibacter soli TaxID=3034157 RepID=UPI0030136BE8
MKKLYSFILSWFILINIFAQSSPLQAHLEGGKPYLLHTVVAKENWYSIGRLYNISPKDIAPFNGTSLDKGLSIGQTVKIPLVAANFIQSGQPGADEVAVPVVHNVKEKENLYRIGQQYNKVGIDQLRAWNGLSGDEVSKDLPLVIGYLKVKKSISPLAATGKSKIGGSVAIAATKPPVTKPAVTEAKKEDKAVVTKQETAAIPPPGATRSEPSPPAAKTEAVPVSQPTVTNINTGDGGVFKSLFDEQSKAAAEKENLNGQAAVFKSTSGWKDSKYYALMNKVLPGTIVKVYNPQNSKFVYAKVLGEIPPGKENEGLSVRISNAAAAELALAETGRYELQLSWAKQ